MKVFFSMLGAVSTTNFVNNSYLFAPLLWKYDMYEKEKKTPFDTGYQCTTQLTSGDLELSDIQNRGYYLHFVGYVHYGL